MSPSLNTRLFRACQHPDSFHADPPRLGRGERQTAASERKPFTTCLSSIFEQRWKAHTMRLLLRKNSCASCQKNKALMVFLPVLYLTSVSFQRMGGGGVNSPKEWHYRRNIKCFLSLFQTYSTILTVCENVLSNKRESNPQNVRWRRMTESGSTSLWWRINCCLSFNCSNRRLSIQC